MKIKRFNEIINRFYYKEKIKLYFLIALSLFAGLFEYIGLIFIFQFVLFLSNPNTIYCKKIIYFFEKYLGIVDFSYIALFLGLFVASIYIFKNIFMFVFTKYNYTILEDLSVKMSLKTIENFLYQDFLIVNSIKTDEKLNAVQKITIIVWQYCLKYINLIINCTIIFILSLYLFIKFTIPAIIAIVFISILSFVEYKYLKNRSNYQNKYFSSAFDAINSIILKIISSIKEIKLNNKEELFLKNAQENFIEFANLNKDRSYNNVFHIYFTEISIMIALMAVIVTLFYTTNFNNQLLISSISTICVIVLRLTPAINRAQSCLYSIDSNEKTVLEFLKIDDLFDKNVKKSRSNETLKLGKKIELKNVCFNYPNQSKSLKNINLTINKGDFIGIVGKSGSFKTTLLLLLTGLIKPNSGEILIDDVKLSDNNLKNWQNNVSLLSQDFILLNEMLNSIDNELLNKLSLENDSIEKNKSQGQKQRLALANILKQDKEVLLLDEATSSIDVLSEDKINSILKEIMNKKTIISVAHRLQILKYCTKIVYMDSDRIIDCDTFQNLCDKYGEFNKIVELSNFEI